MSKTEEILDLIHDLQAEVSSGLLTTEEAAELMAYGYVIEN